MGVAGGVFAGAIGILVVIGWTGWRLYRRFVLGATGGGVVER